MRRQNRQWPLPGLVDFGIHSQLNRPLITGLLLALLLVGAPTLRAEDAVPEIKLSDGRFEPQQLELPANTPLKLRVTNADKAAVEFESFELHRERVIQPGETITVYLPALAPGSYKFFDDFHRDTPEGAILVK
jgi:heme/copper-type cytochrome/quinol oxidase subunit 2